MCLENIVDCARSRGESIGTPLDPPFFWLNIIFNIAFCFNHINHFLTLILHTVASDHKLSNSNFSQCEYIYCTCLLLICQPPSPSLLIFILTVSVNFPQCASLPQPPTLESYFFSQCKHISQNATLFPPHSKLQFFSHSASLFSYPTL